MCSLNNKIILLANYTLACAQKPTIKQEAEYEKAIKTKKTRPSEEMLAVKVGSHRRPELQQVLFLTFVDAAKIVKTANNTATLSACPCVHISQNCKT